jgi:DMSO reductase family type II enzyme heme b subunit
MLQKVISYFFILFLVAAAAVAENKSFVEFKSFKKEIDASHVALHDDVWQTIKPYRQPLQRQFLVVPKPAEIGVKEVFVQSINDGKFISFRLYWNDDTKNETPKITGFSDGAAIQFPVSKDDFPEYFMGEEKHPVHILYWKAWRSKDQKSGFQTTKTAYPNMTTDIYTFDYPVKGKGTEKTQAEKDIFIPGRAAGNPMSFPSKEVMTELSSTGPGTITFKKVANTTGDAEWKDGQWTVIFRRPLTVEDTGSVRFATGERMPVAFAVWEGSRNEAGGRKAVSPAWAEVEVEK